MQRLSKEQFEEQFGSDTYNQFTQPKRRPSFYQTVKDVGIGAAKGVGETVKGLETLGRGIQGAIDPTKTIGETINQPSPFDQFNLQAENTAQKVGKIGEIAAEVLFPIGAVSKGAKTTGAIFEGLGSRVGSISDDAFEGGLKVKDKILDAVANLDDRTRSALTRTPREKFEAVLKQGQDALLDDRNRTPLEAVGDNVISGLTQLKSQTDAIGAAKGELLKSANVGFKKVGNIAQRTALDIQKSFSDIKLDKSDMKVINEFKDELTFLGKNPSLKEVDATIDLLQDKLYKSTRSNVLEVTDRVTGTLRSQLGKLNSELKKIGGEQYTKLNQDYSDNIQIINELNARLGKEGASAGSFVKRLFSPSDARTKELFEQLQQKTGEDYFRDARLAKFVMDVLGDTRSASILKQIPDSSAGIIGKVLEKAKEKIADPIDAARRIINRN